MRVFKGVLMVVCCAAAIVSVGHYWVTLVAIASIALFVFDTNVENW